MTPKRWQQSSLWIFVHGSNLGASLHVATLPNARWHFPEMLSRDCRAGRISNYLKPCCSAIVQIWIFSYDRWLLYRFDHCVYGLEGCTNGYWRFGPARWRNLVLYCKLHLSKTNSNEVSRRILKHSAFSLIITHRPELYLSLVGKKCRFFCACFRKYFSICSSNIYYTICFDYFQQLNLSRSKAVRSLACPQNPGRPRCPDWKIFRHDQRLEWKDTVKNREVSQMK